MAKRALITGITGQDGAYLSKLLLGKGYEVYGGFRQSGSPDFSRLKDLGVCEDVKLEAFDLLETTNMLRVVEKVRPDEVYNLAAQSHVALSYEQPAYTGDADGLGVARFLEVLRVIDARIKFFQASSSEMFGKVVESPQTERTAFHPRSPYAVAKLYAHWISINYREAYGLHTCSGILFNHESPLRSRTFVTRKITSGFALIRAGKLDSLELGNLDAERDWGFAGDYVDGMWRMLQAASAEDYVIATGESHSVMDFASAAAHAAGFDLEFQGSAENRIGIDRKSGRKLVWTNPALYRPAEVDVTTGNPAKAAAELGWRPTVTFHELVAMMVEADIRRVESRQIN